MYQIIERGICVLHLNIEWEWMVNGDVGDRGFISLRIASSVHTKSSH